MFQTNSEFLSVLWNFVRTGIIFALFCDAVRFVRIALDGGRTAVFFTDLVLAIISAPVMMFASVEYGFGIMRFYYILAMIFGMLGYFFTIGFITRFIAIGIGKVVGYIKKRLKNLIYNPVVMLFGFIKQRMLNIFEQIRQKTAKNKENLQLSLKKHTAMLYNNKIGKLCVNGGEKKNVVKAKVRKKA